mgnify:CR=1 FL=1
MKTVFLNKLLKAATNLVPADDELVRLMEIARQTKNGKKRNTKNRDIRKRIKSSS